MLSATTAKTITWATEGWLVCHCLLCLWPPPHGIQDVAPWSFYHLRAGPPGARTHLGLADQDIQQSRALLCRPLDLSPGGRPSVPCPRARVGLATAPWWWNPLRFLSSVLQ